MSGLYKSAMPIVRLILAIGIGYAVTKVPLALGSGVNTIQESDSSSSKSQVLILTGKNNHDWKRTSPLIQSTLAQTGLFDITVWLGPGRDTPKDQINAPEFSDFDVVIWDYNPRDRWSGDDSYQWPQELRHNWETYISNGGTAFLIHASNNPFPGWDAFEQMVGLLWRDQHAGCAHYFDEDGTRVTIEAGQGNASGHGKKHQYTIKHRVPDHPVLAGLPIKWLHAHDELYHWQRGPCPESMEILAVAWNDSEIGGTDRYEPLLWQIPYGQGTVMTWLPGHLMGDQTTPQAYQCVGFQTVLIRSVEWLASGQVTTPIPADFPTEHAVSLREFAPEPQSED